MVVAVNALGITQITAWGTSYYCLGVLAKPIVELMSRWYEGAQVRARSRVATGA